MTQARRASRSRVLRGRAEFEPVLRGGSRSSTRNFVVRAHPNALAHPRLGIIAARKVAPRSVDRNRGKRFIREAFRAAADELGALDITVQIRGDLRDVPADALRAELRTLFQTASRRRAKPSTTA